MEPTHLSRPKGAGARRLCDNPHVPLRCLRRPVAEFWGTAPSWLQDRARLPMTRAQQALWEVIRDPARLGTGAVARVPAWVAEYEAGYVLHFLLPEFGVNVQIDAWKPEYEGDDPPDVDFEEEPDHPLNDSRAEDLRETFGIETLRFPEAAVLDAGAEAICEEIRREVGLARPRAAKPP